jgi:membrane-associated phospholipid phosphatase
MITLEAPARGRGVALPEQQAQRAYEALDRYGDDLAGHVYLRSPSGHTTAATLVAGLLARTVAHHRHSRVACWLA